jgi:hypothetical protein
MPPINFEEIEKLEELISRHQPLPMHRGHVKEIIVYQKNLNAKESSQRPTGEFEMDRVSNPSLVLEKETPFILITRMCRYIADLAERAMEVHVKDNFKDPEGYLQDYQLRKQAILEATRHLEMDDFSLQQKLEEINSSPRFADTIEENKLDNITRLSLTEFSLYPRKEQGPLTIPDFNLLTKKIELIAKNCPENLHLLIATVPVKTINNEVQNIALYVQCGMHPVINVFTKVSPHPTDPQYPGTTYPAYSLRDPECAGGLFRTPHQIFAVAALGSSADLDKDAAMNIYYGGNILVRTVGDSIFRVAIDICFDNFDHISKQRVNQDIQSARAAGEDVLPHKVSYIVSSNTTTIEPKGQVSSYTVHADQKNPGFSLFKEPLSEQIIPAPAFGSHAVMQIYPQSKMRIHDEIHAQQISIHNDMTRRLGALRQYRLHHPEQAEEVRLEIEKLILNQFCQELTSISEFAPRELVQDYYGKFKKFADSPTECYPEIMETFERLSEKIYEHYRSLMLSSQADVKKFDFAISTAKGLLQREKEEVELKSEQSKKQSEYEKIRKQVRQEMLGDKQEERKKSTTSTLSFFKAVSEQQIIATMLNIRKLCSTQQSTYLEMGKMINGIINNIIRRRLKSLINTHTENIVRKEDDSQLQHHMAEFLQHLDQQNSEHPTFQEETLMLIDGFVRSYPAFATVLAPTQKLMALTKVVNDPYDMDQLSKDEKRMLFDKCYQSITAFSNAEERLMRLMTQKAAQPSFLNDAIREANACANQMTELERYIQTLNMPSACEKHSSKRKP